MSNLIPWTAAELREAVLQYAAMWELQRVGMKVVKVHRARDWSMKSDRSTHEVLLKWKQISLLLRNAGFEPLAGLQPAKQLHARLAARIARQVIGAINRGAFSLDPDDEVCVALSLVATSVDAKKAEWRRPAGPAQDTSSTVHQTRPLIIKPSLVAATPYRRGDWGDCDHYLAEAMPRQFALRVFPHGIRHAPVDPSYSALPPDEYAWATDQELRNMLQTLDLTHSADSIVPLLRRATGGRFESMSLREQAALLDIKVQRISEAELPFVATARSDKGRLRSGPEVRVKHWFKSHGYEAEYWEGYGLLILEVAIKLGIVYEGAADAIRRYRLQPSSYEDTSFQSILWRAKKVRRRNGWIDPSLEGKTELVPEAESLIRTALGCIGAERLFDVKLYCVELFVNERNIRADRLQSVDVDQLAQFCRVAGVDLLTKYYLQRLMGFGGSVYGGTFGAPDLTVWKAAESSDVGALSSSVDRGSPFDGVKFLEVKLRDDRLSRVQGLWVRNVARPLGMRVELVHVV